MNHRFSTNVCMWPMLSFILPSCLCSLITYDPGETSLFCQLSHQLLGTPEGFPLEHFRSCQDGLSLGCQFLAEQKQKQPKMPFRTLQKKNEKTLMSVFCSIYIFFEHLINRIRLHPKISRSQPAQWSNGKDSPTHVSLEYTASGFYSHGETVLISGHNWLFLNLFKLYIPFSLTVYMSI